MRIDLHAHSRASDGTDSPARLVAIAAEAELDVVAVTDHDTTDGWDEAAAAVPSGVRLLRGAEFSCLAPAESDESGATVSVHLLGYLFDPHADAIVAEQARLRTERRERLYEMSRRMAHDGLPVDPDEVVSGQAPAGRPHLARALVAAGVVETVDEAFRRYLAAGKPYYLPRADTDVVTAVTMVRAAGGVPVLAHPLARTRGPVIAAEAIDDLVDAGLAGLEADHPDHEEADRAEVRNVAQRFGLFVTGSSDYHGQNKTVRLGQEQTSDEACQRIIAMATGVPVIDG